MAEIYKDGQILYNFIDNDGQSDRSSLGARYAKGRADNTDNNLRLNYFTKEQVYELLDGVAKTYIVSEMPTAPYFILSEDTVAVAGKVYYAVTFVQDADPISPEMANLYERKAFLPPWSQDPQIYYELADPTTWDPATKAYFKVDTATQREFQEGAAITEVVYTQEPRYPEPNTYYLVGNDTDGYELYYWDSDLQEAYVGSYDIDLSEYQKKINENDSPLENLSDNDKVTWLDITNNTAWEVMLKDIKKYILDAVYPVGSIYTTVTTENPADKFGGTWEIVAPGRYLRGEAEGGTAGNLIYQQLPNIKGQVSLASGSQGHPELSGASGAFQIASAGNLTYPQPSGTSGGSRILRIDASKQTNSIYKDNGNVIPNSYTVFFWRRTA